MQMPKARITPGGKHIALTKGELTPPISTNSRLAAQTTIIRLRPMAAQRSGVIGGNSGNMLSNFQTKLSGSSTMPQK